MAKNDQPWELYDIDADRVELHDLAAQEPARVSELSAAWEAWAKQVGVRPWDEIGGKKKVGTRHVRPPHLPRRLGPHGRQLRRVLGANDRVGVGFIGYGLIGKRHVARLPGSSTDVDLVAVAEVHRGRLDEAEGASAASRPGYADFRKLLDDKDVDAVVVSTPDHWHALMTMMACAAGKDVYVEKPLTLFVREGRWMIDVATRHKRVVQVGTQQRSGPHYQQARELIRDGHIGKVVSVRMSALPEHHAGLRQPARRRPAGRPRLRPLARPGPGAAVQPEPRPLPLPLVLGLLRRADDQPRRAPPRHRPLVPRARRRRRPSPASAAGSR